MKPWKINIIIILVVVLFAMALPKVYIKNFTLAVSIFSAAWTYTDSKKIELSKYKTKWFAPTSSPLMMAILVFVLWLVFLPLYIFDILFF